MTLPMIMFTFYLALQFKRRHLLLFVGLRHSQYLEYTIAWNDMITDELERIWKEAVMKSTIFCLPPPFTLVSWSVYFLTLKMEAICPTETSADTQRSYIPEDGTLHNHRSENLKSYKAVMI
jgi:hypothetical protein